MQLAHGHDGQALFTGAGPWPRQEEVDEVLVALPLLRHSSGMVCLNHLLQSQTEP